MVNQEIVCFLQLSILFPANCFLLLASYLCLLTIAFFCLLFTVLLPTVILPIPCFFLPFRAKISNSFGCKSIIDYICIPFKEKEQFSITQKTVKKCQIITKPFSL